jgi:hypothetical protein
MRSCAYCGKENDVDAAVCVECGTEFLTQPQNGGSTVSEIRVREILTDPVRLFRALVLVSTVTYLFCFFQLSLGGRLISAGTWDALSWHGYGALLPLSERLGWLFLLLFVAVAVGLLTFSKSARLVFAMLAAFFIVMCLLGGVQVQTAYGSFFLLLTNMADGAILVMAYTAPLKERFM